MQRIKTIILLLMLAFLLVTPALAATLPDFLSDYEVARSEKEIEALRLAAEWSDKPANPVRLNNGKVVFVLGATMPTVIAAPWHISDIELEPGEAIMDILVGDSSRWMVETGTSGSAKGDISHVFVKPVDAGLSTTLVITTSKRVYHLKLVSRKSETTPYVAFLYPEQALALQRQAQTTQYWQSVDVDGKKFDMSNLNFNYKVTGRAAWKPVQVYDAGGKTYLKLPDNLTGEIPVLLVLQGSQETLVNYRYRNNTFEVDGVFEKLVLVTGVGWDQQKVTVTRGADAR